MPEQVPTISAIVVSYNSREMTLRCLRSLFADLDGISSETFLVDNASSDGTVEAVRAQFPGMKVIANASNVGFGAANNQAMKESKGRYLLLLNSDAFPERGAVEKLVAYLEAHPHVAAVGPRLVHPDGSLQVSCFPFPSPLRAWLENLWVPKALPHTSRLGDYRKWAHDCERMVDWVIGACLLVRRQAYEQVGGFDERFFMYAEESDWQRRMRDAGWEIAFTPSAQVQHLGGGSGAADRPRINRYFFQSLDYYELKHHGPLGLMALRGAMILGSALRLPGWAAVLALAPKRRHIAMAKVKLLSWLLVRQATDWKVGGLKPSCS